MAFITASRGGRWEVRESRATDAGPRSRTLATFTELTDEVIDRARARASKSLVPEEIRRAALRVGAPLAEPPVERAARDLLGQLEAGRRPRRALRRLLGDALASEERPSDSARSAAPWIGATATQRGDALHDLLLLADKLPAPPRRGATRFPRLDSA